MIMNISDSLIGLISFIFLVLIIVAYILCLYLFICESLNKTLLNFSKEKIVRQSFGIKVLQKKVRSRAFQKSKFIRFLKHLLLFLKYSLVYVLLSVNPKSLPFAEKIINDHQKEKEIEEEKETEEEISFYQNLILEVYTCENSPQEWAMAQYNLGNAYLNRIKGEHEKNIENAINCYQSALKIYTQDAFPNKWATIQHMLGFAYNCRMRGDRAKNIEGVQSHHQSAFQIQFSFVFFVLYFVLYTIASVFVFWHIDNLWCKQNLFCLLVNNEFFLYLLLGYNIFGVIFFCISGLLAARSLRFLSDWLKSLLLSNGSTNEIKTSQRTLLKLFLTFLVLHFTITFIGIFYAINTEIISNFKDFLTSLNYSGDIDEMTRQKLEIFLSDLTNFPEISRVKIAIIKSFDLFIRFFAYILGFKLSHHLIVENNIFSRSDLLAIFRFVKFKISLIFIPDLLKQSVINDIFRNKRKLIYIIFNFPRMIRVLLIMTAIVLGIIFQLFLSRVINFEAGGEILLRVFNDSSLDTPSKILFFIFGFSIIGWNIIVPILVILGMVSVWRLLSSSKPKFVKQKDVINEVSYARNIVSDAPNYLTLEDAHKILTLIERSLKNLNLKSSQCQDLEFECTQKTVNDFFYIVYWIIDSNLYSSIESTNQIILAVGTACNILCEKLDISSSSSTELATKIYPLVVDRFDLNSYRWPRYKFHYQRYLVLGGKALVESSQSYRINHIEDGIKMLDTALRVRSIDEKIQKDYPLNIPRFIYKIWTQILISTTNPRYLDDKFLKFAPKEVIYLELGKAYALRVYGDIDDNSQKAISYLLKSLNLSKSKENLGLQNLVNLELCKTFLRDGKYQDINLSKEIARQLFMSNSFSPNHFPEKWIDLCFTLSLVYLELLGSEQTEYTRDLQDFIANLFSSLFTLLNDKDQPRLWAKSTLIASDFCLYVHKPQRALVYALEAFEVLDPLKNQFPIYWSEASGQLGRIYNDLGDVQNAILRFRGALQVFEPKYSPKDCLKIAANLGNLGYRIQNWEIAIEGYNQAILAIEQSRYWATSEATKRELIANSLDIYQKMVQACINHQDYAQALLTVERSKSRTLLELLDSANLYPKNATDAQKQRISDLRRQIAIYQQQLVYTSNDTLTPTTENNPNQPSPETLIRQQLQAANQQFQDLLKELDDPNFTLTQQVPAQLPDLRRLLPPQTALIEWYLPTDANTGFYTFLVTRRDEQIQITPHHFSAEDRQHLDQALQDYRSDYGKPSWNEQLPQRLETLSAALQLPRLLAELSEIQHLILIPHRELHLIPLHALPVPSSPRSGRGAGGEGKPLQDWFPVQYAPSCQIFNTLQQRPPLEEPSTSFFALQNPTQDLDYADFEVEVLRRLFDPERVLSHHEATKTALEQPQNRAFLQQSRYIHFSCHGEFNEAEPLNAYLRLANREKLTFQDIFTSLDIPNCRLLILSACKTGLVETPPTDDYVGLASAFFFAGTRTVVGSLWEAEQFSSAILMIRLYQELPRYSSVVMALRAAQDWLRTISREGVLTWLRDELKLDEVEIEICQQELLLFDPERPFAPARYWAAFSANGQ